MGWATTQAQCVPQSAISMCCSISPTSDGSVWWWIRLQLEVACCKRLRNIMMQRRRGFTPCCHLLQETTTCICYGRIAILLQAVIYQKQGQNHFPTLPIKFQGCLKHTAQSQNLTRHVRLMRFHFFGTHVRPQTFETCHGSGHVFL